MALFLIISMVEGIAFITTTAPLTMADPDMHLPSTYALATGQSFNITRAPESHRQYDPRTSEVPSSIRSAADNCSQEKHDISKAA